MATSHSVPPIDPNNMTKAAIQALTSQIQKVIDNKAQPGDTITFEEGTYPDLQIKIDKKLTLDGTKATVTSTGPQASITITGENVTVDGFTFKGDGLVHFKLVLIDSHTKKPLVPPTVPHNGKITNCTFTTFDGYAKRIKVGDESHDELYHTNILIENNTFESILGRGNAHKNKEGKIIPGKPGGELISIKAGGTTAQNNHFEGCRGLLSLRGGANNIARGNTFKKPVGECGIQAYGPYAQILNNTFDENCVLHIGAGQEDTAPGKQEHKGAHLPANNATIMHNTGWDGEKAGKVVINFELNKSLTQDGKKLTFTCPVTGVSLDDVEKNNSFQHVTEIALDPKYKKK